MCWQGFLSQVCICFHLRPSWGCMESVGCSGHKSQHTTRHKQARTHNGRFFVISNQGQVIMGEKVCGKAVLFQSQEENQEWYGNNFCGENDVYFKPWLEIHLAVLTAYTHKDQVVAQPGNMQGCWVRRLENTNLTSGMPLYFYPNNIINRDCIHLRTYSKFQGLWC